IKPVSRVITDRSKMRIWLTGHCYLTAVVNAVASPEGGGSAAASSLPLVVAAGCRILLSFQAAAERQGVRWITMTNGEDDDDGDENDVPETGVLQHDQDYLRDLVDPPTLRAIR